MHAHGTGDMFDEHGISLVHIHECGKQNAPQAPHHRVICAHAMGLPKIADARNAGVVGNRIES